MKTIVTNFKTQDLNTIEKYRERLDGIIDYLDQTALEAPTDIVLQKLLLGRIRSSSTLLDLDINSENVFSAESSDLENWFNALNFVSENIQKNIEFNLDSLLEINAILLGLNPDEHSFRKAELTLDGFKCFPADQIDYLLSKAWAEFLSYPTEDLYDGVYKTALFYQSILSIHPFADGNGRTARLFLDWALGLMGFPPVTFKNKSETVLALLPDRPRSPGFENPMSAVLLGVENTLEILRGSNK